MSTFGCCSKPARSGRSSPAFSIVSSVGRWLPTPTPELKPLFSWRLLRVTRGTCAFLVAALQFFTVPLGGETTKSVSDGLDGAATNGAAWFASVSASGRYIAFHSDATNLVLGDTNGRFDVFVSDSYLHTIRRVSIASDGDEGNHDSSYPSISGDGRFVAFGSWASNLVSDDAGQHDVFVHDLLTGATVRVSIATDGSPSTLTSNNPAISAEGRYVAFGSQHGFVAEDDNSAWDVYVRDLQTGQTTLASTKNAMAGPAGQSNHPAISAGGRFVAFTSYAATVVSGDTNGKADVFVRDRESTEVDRVSVASTGGQATGESKYPSISGDGRFVAFESDAPDLISADTNGCSDVFVHDRASGETTRVSEASGGGQGNGPSTWAKISIDGRYVTFESLASNLVASDSNGVRDIFVRDLHTGETQRVSIGSSGTQANGDSSFGAVSANGRIIAFDSIATNLAADDLNAARTVFRHERLTNPEPPGARDLIGSLDPLKPTVVLIHGLQNRKPCDDDCDLCGVNNCIDRLWTGSGFAQAQNLIGWDLGSQLAHVNLVQYVWEEAFQQHDCAGTAWLGLGYPDEEAYVAARGYVDEAGARLARILLEGLGSNYNLPIHFVGHSLGTAVSTVAAAEFLGVTQVSEAQLTALDRPDDISPEICEISEADEARWGFDENFFASMLRVPRPELTIWLDNYFSRSGGGVGDLANGPALGEAGLAALKVYNYRELDDPKDLDAEVFPNEGVANNHSGVHQWYRWTMSPENPVTGGLTVCPGGVFVPPASISPSLDPCEKGWWWSLVRPGGAPRGPNAKPMDSSVMVTAVSGDAQEFGCSVQCPPFPSCPGGPGAATRIICSEPEPASPLPDTIALDASQYSAPQSAVLTIAPPEGAAYFWFDFQFVNRGDGDHAAALLDGQTIWLMNGESLLDEDVRTAGPIPLGDFTSERQLEVQLYSKGSANATVEISNLRFSFEARGIFWDDFEKGNTHHWSAVAP